MDPSTASVPDLAHIFEPVRDELKRVEREFARHLESRVELIPEMGKYVQMSGGKRDPPGRAAHVCAPLRLHGRPCRAQRGGRRVHPHGDARPRRHHRWRRHAPRPADRALPVGQRHHRAARRLPLHPLDGDGAHAGQPRGRPAPLRLHAEDDRGRALSAHQDRRREHHRGRALRDHPPQDRAPVFRLRRNRRPARPRVARTAHRACASTASTSASRFRSWTTCWITWRTSQPSASRSAATSGKARSRCRSFSSFSAPAPKWPQLINGVVADGQVTVETLARDQRPPRPPRRGGHGVRARDRSRRPRQAAPDGSVPAFGRAGRARRSLSRWPTTVHQSAGSGEARRAF